MEIRNDHGHPQGNMSGGLGLTPWGTAIGLRCEGQDVRLIGLQSALNRFQVWIGDLFIRRAARHARPQEPERAPDPGRALTAGHSARG